MNQPNSPEIRRTKVRSVLRGLRNVGIGVTATMIEKWVGGEVIKGVSTIIGPIPPDLLGPGAVAAAFFVNTLLAAYGGSIVPNLKRDRIAHFVPDQFDSPNDIMTTINDPSVNRDDRIQ